MTNADLFFGTNGPHDARIMIVGEAWGKTEEQEKLPLVGSSGYLLDTLLAACGVDRKEVFCTNIMSARPSNNDMRAFFYSNLEVKNGRAGKMLRGLYPKPELLDGLTTLQRQIEAVRPDIIIGLGNYPLWALTEDNFTVRNDEEHRYKVPRGIGQWRGSQLYTINGIRFLPIYHPAAALRQHHLEYLIKHDLKERLPKLVWDAPDYNFIIRPNYSQVMSTLDMLTRRADVGPLKLAHDLETRSQQIACSGIAWSRTHAICIPFMCVEDEEGYWTENEELAITIKQRELLTHKNVRLSGQNYLYDAQYDMLQWSFIPRIYFDTMIAHHVCWPGTPRGLDYLSSLYCDYHCYWKDEGKEWHPSLPEDQLWRYNCKDAVATFEITDVLRGLIVALGLEEQWEFQRESIDMALEMMLRGVRIDKKRRADTAMDLSTALAYRADELDAIIPEDVYPRKKKASKWFKSPKQQMEIFYDLLGIKPVAHRKTRKPTINDIAFNVIKKREPLLIPIIEKLQELRTIGVFYSTFTQAKLDTDSRMRCSYDPSGTETYRYNSSENAFGTGTNLQNIPKGQELED